MLGAGAAPHSHRGHRALEQPVLSSLCLCHCSQELQEAGALLEMRELLLLWKNSSGRSWHGLELLLGGAGKHGVLWDVTWAQSRAGTGKGDKCPCATLSPWSCRVRSPLASLQLCVHLCDRNIPVGIVKSCLQFTS